MLQQNDIIWQLLPFGGRRASFDKQRKFQWLDDTAISSRNGDGEELRVTGWVYKNSKRFRGKCSKKKKPWSIASVFYLNTLKALRPDVFKLACDYSASVVSVFWSCCYHDSVNKKKFETDLTRLTRGAPFSSGGQEFCLTVPPTGQQFKSTTCGPTAVCFCCFFPWHFWFSLQVAAK